MSKYLVAHAYAEAVYNRNGLIMGQELHRHWSTFETLKLARDYASGIKPVEGVREVTITRILGD